MITLKFASYTQTEVDELARLLEDVQAKIQTHCNPGTPCRTCPYRHLCMDVQQATMYAEEYKVKQ